MTRCWLLGWTLCLTMLLTACTPKIGPRPLLSQLRASRASAEGVTTVWGRVQARFKDVKEGTGIKGLMEKLNEEVAFEVETGASKEKYIPAMVPSTAETLKTTDGTWQDQLTVDFVIFATGVGREPFRLHATDYYQSKDDEPCVADLTPLAEQGPLPRVTRVEIAPAEKGKKAKITAILDQDASADVTAWHHQGGMVSRMERKGSRIFTREFKDDGSADAKVVLVSGDVWVSPPAAPPSGRPDAGAKGEDDKGGE